MKLSEIYSNFCNTLHQLVWLLVIAMLAQVVPVEFLHVRSAHAAVSTASMLVAPGTLLKSSHHYSLPVHRSIAVDPQNPFQMNFMVDGGDEEQVDEATAERLTRYFLTFLTIPKDFLWVNLSPYEQNRIIEPALESTVVGRDMLVMDYLLKQLTASLTHPDGEIGRQFWDRVYSAVERNQNVHSSSLGTSTTFVEQIPDFFNKVWIVPNGATVYEYQNSAFIVDSHLKVMTEEDYTVMTQAKGEDQDIDQGMAKRYTDILHDVIVPELEYEVNHGKHFAQLRQMYHSLVLAIWFKRRFKNHVFNTIYSDQVKLDGIALEEAQVAQQVYEQYLQALKVGVYDFIQEDYDPAVQDIVPRKYFSGGMPFDQAYLNTRVVTDSAQLSFANLSSSMFRYTANFFSNGATNQALPNTLPNIGEGSNFTTPFQLNVAHQRKNADSQFVSVVFDSLNAGEKFDEQTLQNIIEQAKEYHQKHGYKNAVALLKSLSTIRDIAEDPKSTVYQFRANLDRFFDQDQINALSSVVNDTQAKAKLYENIQTLIQRVTKDVLETQSPIELSNDRSRRMMIRNGDDPEARNAKDLGRVLVDLEVKLDQYSDQFITRQADIIGRKKQTIEIFQLTTDVQAVDEMVRFDPETGVISFDPRLIHAVKQNVQGQNYEFTNDQERDEFVLDQVQSQIEDAIKQSHLHRVKQIGLNNLNQPVLVHDLIIAAEHYSPEAVVILETYFEQYSRLSVEAPELNERFLKWANWWAEEAQELRAVAVQMEAITNPFDGRVSDSELEERLSDEYVQLLNTAELSWSEIKSSLRSWMTGDYQAATTEDDQQNLSVSQKIRKAKASALKSLNGENGFLRRAAAILFLFTFGSILLIAGSQDIIAQNGDPVDFGADSNDLSVDTESDSLEFDFQQSDVSDYVWGVGYDISGGQAQDDLQALKAFVTFEDVQGLVGQTNELTGQVYDFNTNEIETNWDSIFESQDADWMAQTVIVAAQEKLGVQADGYFGQETREALQKKIVQSENPVTPVSTVTMDSTQKADSVTVQSKPAVSDSVWRSSLALLGFDQSPSENKDEINIDVLDNDVDPDGLSVVKPIIESSSKDVKSNALATTSSTSNIVKPTAIAFSTTPVSTSFSQASFTSQAEDFSRAASVVPVKGEIEIPVNGFLTGFNPNQTRYRANEVIGTIFNPFVEARQNMTARQQQVLQNVQTTYQNLFEQSAATTGEVLNASNQVQRLSTQMAAAGLGSGVYEIRSIDPIELTTTQLSNGTFLRKGSKHFSYQAMNRYAVQAPMSFTHVAGLLNGSVNAMFVNGQPVGNIEEVTFSDHYDLTQVNVEWTMELNGFKSSSFDTLDVDFEPLPERTGDLYDIPAHHRSTQVRVDVPTYDIPAGIDGRFISRVQAGDQVSAGDVIGYFADEGHADLFKKLTNQRQGILATLAQAQKDAETGYRSKTTTEIAELNLELEKIESQMSAYQSQMNLGSVVKAPTSGTIVTVANHSNLAAGDPVATYAGDVFIGDSNHDDPSKIIALPLTLGLLNSGDFVVVEGTTGERVVAKITSVKRPLNTINGANLTGYQSIEVKLPGSLPLVQNGYVRVIVPRADDQELLEKEWKRQKNSSPRRYHTPRTFSGNPHLASSSTPVETSQVSNVSFQNNSTNVVQASYSASSGSSDQTVGFDFDETVSEYDSDNVMVESSFGVLEEAVSKNDFLLDPQTRYLQAVQKIQQQYPDAALQLDLNAGFGVIGDGSLQPRLGVSGQSGGFAFNVSGGLQGAVASAVSGLGDLFKGKPGKQKIIAKHLGNVAYYSILQNQANTHQQAFDLWVSINAFDQQIQHFEAMKASYQKTLDVLNARLNAGADPYGPAAEVENQIRAIDLQISNLTTAKETTISKLQNFVDPNGTFNIDQLSRLETQRTYPTISFQDIYDLGLNLYSVKSASEMFNVVQVKKVLDRFKKVPDNIDLMNYVKWDKDGIGFVDDLNLWGEVQHNGEKIKDRPWLLNLNIPLVGNNRQKRNLIFSAEEEFAFNQFEFALNAAKTQVKSIVDQINGLAQQIKKAEKIYYESLFDFNHAVGANRSNPAILPNQLLNLQRTANQAFQTLQTYKAQYHELENQLRQMGALPDGKTLGQKVKPVHFNQEKTHASPSYVQRASSQLSTVTSMFSGSKQIGFANQKSNVKPIEKRQVSSHSRFHPGMFQFKFTNSPQAKFISNQLVVFGQKGSSRVSNGTSSVAMTPTGFSTVSQTNPENPLTMSSLGDVNPLNQQEAFDYLQNSDPNSLTEQMALSVLNGDAPKNQMKKNLFHLTRQGEIAILFKIAIQISNQSGLDDPRMPLIYDAFDVFANPYSETFQQSGFDQVLVKGLTQTEIQQTLINYFLHQPDGVGQVAFFNHPDWFDIEFLANTYHDLNRYIEDYSLQSAEESQPQMMNALERLLSRVSNELTRREAIYQYEKAFESGFGSQPSIFESNMFVGAHADEVRYGYFRYLQNTLNIDSMNFNPDFRDMVDENKQATFKRHMPVNSNQQFLFDWNRSLAVNVSNLVQTRSHQSNAVYQIDDSSGVSEISFFDQMSASQQDQYIQTLTPVELQKLLKATSNGFFQNKIVTQLLTFPQGAVWAVAVYAQTDQPALAKLIENQLTYDQLFQSISGLQNAGLMDLFRKGLKKMHAKRLAMERANAGGLSLSQGLSSGQIALAHAWTYSPIELHNSDLEFLGGPSVRKAFLKFRSAWKAVGFMTILAEQSPSSARGSRSSFYRVAGGQSFLQEITQVTQLSDLNLFSDSWDKHVNGVSLQGSDELKDQIVEPLLKYQQEFFELYETNDQTIRGREIGPSLMGWGLGGLLGILGLFFLGKLVHEWMTKTRMQVYAENVSTGDEVFNVDEAMLSFRQPSQSVDSEMVQKHFKPWLEFAESWKTDNDPDPDHIVKDLNTILNGLDDIMIRFVYHPKLMLQMDLDGTKTDINEKYFSTIQYTIFIISQIQQYVKMIHEKRKGFFESQHISHLTYFLWRTKKVLTALDSYHYSLDLRGGLDKILGYRYPKGHFLEWFIFYPLARLFLGHSVVFFQIPQLAKPLFQSIFKLGNDVIGHLYLSKDQKIKSSQERLKVSIDEGKKLHSSGGGSDHGQRHRFRDFVSRYISGLGMVYLFVIKPVFVFTGFFALSFNLFDMGLVLMELFLFVIGPGTHWWENINILRATTTKKMRNAISEVNAGLQKTFGNFEKNFENIDVKAESLNQIAAAFKKEQQAKKPSFQKIVIVPQKGSSGGVYQKRLEKWIAQLRESGLIHLGTSVRVTSGNLRGSGNAYWAAHEEIEEMDYEFSSDEFPDDESLQELVNALIRDGLLNQQEKFQLSQLNQLLRNTDWENVIGDEYSNLKYVAYSNPVRAGRLFLEKKYQSLTPKYDQKLKTGNRLIILHGDNQKFGDKHLLVSALGEGLQLMQSSPKSHGVEWIIESRNQVSVPFPVSFDGDDGDIVMISHDISVGEMNQHIMIDRPENFVENQQSNWDEIEGLYRKLDGPQEIEENQTKPPKEMSRAYLNLRNKYDLENLKVNQIPVFAGQTLLKKKMVEIIRRAWNQMNEKPVYKNDLQNLNLSYTLDFLNVVIKSQSDDFTRQELMVYLDKRLEFDDIRSSLEGDVEGKKMALKGLYLILFNESKAKVKAVIHQPHLIQVTRIDSPEKTEQLIQFAEKVFAEKNLSWPDELKASDIDSEISRQPQQAGEGYPSRQDVFHGSSGFEEVDDSENQFLDFQGGGRADDASLTTSKHVGGLDYSQSEETIDFIPMDGDLNLNPTMNAINSNQLMPLNMFKGFRFTISGLRKVDMSDEMLTSLNEDQSDTVESLLRDLQGGSDDEPLNDGNQWDNEFDTFAYLRNDV